MSHYPHLDLPDRLDDLIDALEGRLDTRASEVADAAETFLEALERADREASTIQRLVQVVRTRGVEGRLFLPSLDSLQQVGGAAAGQQKHIKRLRDEYDAVLSAMLTLDRKQELLKRDLAKKDAEAREAQEQPDQP